MIATPRGDSRNVQSSHGAALRQFSLNSSVNTFAHVLERMGYSNTHSLRSSITTVHTGTLPSLFLSFPFFFFLPSSLLHPDECEERRFFEINS